MAARQETGESAQLLFPLPPPLVASHHVRKSQYKGKRSEQSRTSLTAPSPSLTISRTGRSRHSRRTETTETSSSHCPQRDRAAVLVVGGVVEELAAERVRLGSRVATGVEAVGAAGCCSGRATGAARCGEGE